MAHFRVEIAMSEMLQVKAVPWGGKIEKSERF